MKLIYKLKALLLSVLPFFWSSIEAQAEQQQVVLEDFSPCLFQGEECDLGLKLDLSSDESFQLFPSYGIVSEIDQKINFKIHAWIYELEEHSLLRKNIIDGFKESLGLIQTLPTSNQQLLEKRARYFVVDNEGNKNIKLTFRGKPIAEASSTSNGHVTTSIIATYKGKFEKDIWLAPKIHHSGEKQEAKLNQLIQLLTPKGLSVISDIDDTIKFSNVRNKKALMLNTFALPFTAIQGMPAFYKRLKNLGASFHYVSASPWQLHKPISAFITSSGYPIGSMHLKEFDIFSISTWLNLEKHKSHKIDSIKAILSDFPERKFILIGDSGEKDPEIYLELAKVFPNQIVAILIRLATDQENENENILGLYKNSHINPFLFNDARKLAHWSPPIN